MTRRTQARLKAADQRSSGRRSATGARKRATPRKTYAARLRIIEPAGAGGADREVIRIVEQQRRQDGLALVALDLAKLYAGGGAAALKLVRHAGVRALRACAGTLHAVGGHLNDRRTAATKRLADYPERL